VIGQIEQSIGRSTHAKTVGRRAGDSPKLIAGIDKIKKELDWKPEKSLKEMIDSAWQAWNA
jgi:UDP-glucose 4-epimerase